MFHLVKRFFGHLTAKPLDAVEYGDVEAVLPADLLRLFDSMPPADQRHSFTVWERVNRREHLTQAALLHDVGKSNGPGGAFHRSLATVAIRLHLPLPDGWKTYRDHGSLGADMLRRVGAEPLAVEFAEFHPGRVPDGTDPDDWQALVDADNV